MPRVKSAYLREITQQIFQAAGAPDDVATIVAESLVEADLTGHDSHGVIRIVEYLNQIRAGHLDPKAKPEVVRETLTTLLVDGHWTFGQVTAQWTMNQLIAKAAQYDLGAGGIYRCGHIGRVGGYTAMAAARGFLSMAFVNGGGTRPRVAPFGGIRPVFGTNPLAAAVPGEGQAPIVLDFSTAVVASGKIRIAREKGEELPEGWILNREGQPSRRPQDYYDGGMLLPMAGYKGYALGLLAEVLGGLVTGAGTPILPKSGYQVGNGVFFIALSIAAFRPLAEFAREVGELSETLKATPPLAEGGEVLLPGEPEQRMKARRLADGIDISDEIWQKTVEAARGVGVVI
jgi:hydroxycarboxylate dehydrogenase B